MDGLGQCVFEDGLRQGREDGIRVLIMDNVEEDVSRERIIVKL